MHTCPRCSRNFESVSEMEDHFRTWHTKKLSKNERKELRKAEHEKSKSRSKKSKTERRVEYVRENSSPEKLFKRIEELEKRVLKMEKLIGAPEKESLEAKSPTEFQPKDLALKEEFEGLKKMIGQTREKPLRMGVLRKKVNSNEANVIEKTDYLLKYSQELTEAHNELVKNVDNLVIELRGAFTNVTSAINAPHFTYTVGKGISWEKRL